MLKVLLEGFPGKLQRGWLGWSSVVLMQTECGYMLYDSGNWGDRPGIMSALARLGVSPHDIGQIVLSHLHFDHVANVECFPNARVLLHAAEIDYYKSSADLAIPRFQVATVLAQSKIIVVEGDSGEISPGISWVHTPGHTPGHISIVYSTSGTTTVLAGDAIKHRGELTQGTQAQAWDTLKSSDSIRLLRHLASRFVPGHDTTLTLDPITGEVTASGAATEVLTITVDGTLKDLRYEG